MLQPSVAQTYSKLAIIGLGANLPSSFGKSAETVRHAINLLSGKNLEIQNVSQIYSTPCYPKGAGPDYINAVVTLATNLSASVLLSRLHSIEQSLGRERVSRWGGRVIDLDLLAYEDQISPDLETYQQWLNLPHEQQTENAPEQMILPHPRIQDRAFVLVPLAEIAPDWQHPVLRRSARQLLNDLDPADIAQIVAL